MDKPFAPDNNASTGKSAENDHKESIKVENKPIFIPKMEDNLEIKYKIFIPKREIPKIFIPQKEEPSNADTTNCVNHTVSSTSVQDIDGPIAIKPVSTPWVGSRSPIVIYPDDEENQLSSSSNDKPNLHLSPTDDTVRSARTVEAIVPALSRMTHISERSNIVTYEENSDPFSQFLQKLGHLFFCSSTYDYRQHGHPQLQLTNGNYTITYPYSENIKVHLDHDMMQKLIDTFTEFTTRSDILLDVKGRLQLQIPHDESGISCIVFPDSRFVQIDKTVVKFYQKLVSVTDLLRDINSADFVRSPRDDDLEADDASNNFTIATADSCSSLFLRLGSLFFRDYSEIYDKICGHHELLLRNGIYTIKYSDGMKVYINQHMIKNLIGKFEKYDILRNFKERLMLYRNPNGKPFLRFWNTEYFQVDDAIANFYFNMEKVIGQFCPDNTLNATSTFQVIPKQPLNTLKTPTTTHKITKYLTESTSPSTNSENTQGYKEKSVSSRKRKLTDLCENDSPAEKMVRQTTDHIPTTDLEKVPFSTHGKKNMKGQFGDEGKIGKLQLDLEGEREEVAGLKNKLQNEKEKYKMLQTEKTVCQLKERKQQLLYSEKEKKLTQKVGDLKREITQLQAFLRSEKEKFSRFTAISVRAKKEKEILANEECKVLKKQLQDSQHSRQIAGKKCSELKAQAERDAEQIRQVRSAQNMATAKCKMQARNKAIEEMKTVVAKQLNCCVCNNQVKQATSLGHCGHICCWGCVHVTRNNRCATCSEVITSATQVPSIDRFMGEMHCKFGP